MGPQEHAGEWHAFAMGSMPRMPCGAHVKYGRLSRPPFGQEFRAPNGLHELRCARRRCKAQLGGEAAEYSAALGAEQRLSRPSVLKNSDHGTIRFDDGDGLSWVLFLEPVRRIIGWSFKIAGGAERAVDVDT
jgi:hypothetical protein